MESMLFVVFGADGHRQRESFNKSWSFETERAAVEIFNSDRTGSNLYTLMQITAEDFEACRLEMEGQITDGVFENSRTGEIQELTDGSFLHGDGVEFTFRQAAAGNWCVDVAPYGEEERTYNCFDSIGEAVLFAIKEGAEIKPEYQSNDARIIKAVYLQESIYFDNFAEACRNYSKHAEDLQDLQDQLRADADGMAYPELSYLD